MPAEPIAYAFAPHILVPRWLTGPVWPEGPEWEDVSNLSGITGLSRVLLRNDEVPRSVKLEGPSIRVWVDAEKPAEREGNYRYIVTTRQQEEDADGDVVVYEGDCEAAARQAIFAQAWKWRSELCDACEAARTKKRDPRAGCSMHEPRGVDCIRCSMPAFDVRDAAGEVWCGVCERTFLPTTTTGDCAADWGLWQDSGRRIRLRGGRALWEQATYVDGARVRLSRLEPAPGHKVRQRNSVVDSNAQVALVEA